MAKLNESNKELEQILALRNKEISDYVDKIHNLEKNTGVIIQNLQTISWINEYIFSTFVITFENLPDPLLIRISIAWTLGLDVKHVNVLDTFDDLNLNGFLI